MLVGTKVTIRLFFTDEDGVADDPTTVAVYVKKPDATISTLVATPIVTGEFEADITPTAAGFYYVQGVGTGAVTAVAETQFRADVTEFAAP